MATQFRTNMDRLLAAVLSNSELTKFGNYSAYDYTDIETAEMSNNPTVIAVAKIVRGVSEGKSETAIYNEVSNYLKTKI